MRFFIDEIKSGWFNAKVYFETRESLTITYIQASNIMGEDYVANILKMCKQVVLMEQGYSTAIVSNEAIWKILSINKIGDDEYTFTIYELDGIMEDVAALSMDDLDYKFRYEQRKISKCILRMFIKSVVEAFAPYSKEKSEDYKEHWSNNYSGDIFVFPYEEFEFLQRVSKDW